MHRLCEGNIHPHHTSTSFFSLQLASPSFSYIASLRTKNLQVAFSPDQPAVAKGKLVLRLQEESLTLSEHTNSLPDHVMVGVPGYRDGRAQVSSEIGNDITILYLQLRICQSYYASNSMDLKLKVLNSNDRTDKTGVLNAISHPHTLSFQPLSLGSFTSLDTCRDGNVSV